MPRTENNNKELAVVIKYITYINQFLYLWNEFYLDKDHFLRTNNIQGNIFKQNSDEIVIGNVLAKNLSLKVGDKISLDKAIAEMGNSGSLVKSEGIHLHFELWKDGTPVDPLPFIKDLKSIDSNTLVFNKN